MLVAYTVAFMPKVETEWKKEKKKNQKVNILGVFLSLMFDHFFFFCIFKWKFVPLCTSSSFVFWTTSEILTSATFKMFLRNTNLCDDKIWVKELIFWCYFVAAEERSQFVWQSRCKPSYSRGAAFSRFWTLFFLAKIFNPGNLLIFLTPTSSKGQLERFSAKGWPYTEGGSYW